MNVKLVSITPDAEKTMAYCARVSNPDNQNNPSYDKLIAYCVRHRHWSILEHAALTLEITTSRAISAQILRHRSFTFQEYSQRYAESTAFEIYPARRQDTKNKQNSIDDMSDNDKQWFLDAQNEVNDRAMNLYKEGLSRGIAKEQMRFLLPLSTQTTMYMTGNVRNWVHYIELRSANGTQKEHQDIALECKRIFCEQLPAVAKAMGWL